MNFEDWCEESGGHYFYNRNMPEYPMCVFGDEREDEPVEYVEREPPSGDERPFGDEWVVTYSPEGSTTDSTFYTADDIAIEDDMLVLGDEAVFTADDGDLVLVDK